MFNRESCGNQWDETSDPIKCFSGSRAHKMQLSRVTKTVAKNHVESKKNSSTGNLGEPMTPAHKREMVSLLPRLLVYLYLSFDLLNYYWCGFFSSPPSMSFFSSPPPLLIPSYLFCTFFSPPPPASAFFSFPTLLFLIYHHYCCFLFVCFRANV